MLSCRPCAVPVGHPLHGGRCFLHDVHSPYMPPEPVAGAFPPITSLHTQLLNRWPSLALHLSRPGRPLWFPSASLLLPFPNLISQHLRHRRGCPVLLQREARARRELAVSSKQDVGCHGSPARPVAGSGARSVWCQCCRYLAYSSDSGLLRVVWIQRIQPRWGGDND